MKKIWGFILKLIKQFVTSTDLAVDQATIDLMKIKNPEALLVATDDLLGMNRIEMPGAGQFWENTLGNVVIHPNWCFTPNSLEDLKDIIRKAEGLGHKVRAVGSGHSFSDVAPSKDYIVFTHQLNKYLEIDRNTLTEQAKSLNLYQTEAGIRLHDLNLDLDSKNLALPTMGAFDAQTIIGAISTGTHGTGYSAGSMPGIVRSLVLVSSGG